MRDPYQNCSYDIQQLADGADNMEIFELVVNGDISVETATEVMVVKEEVRRYRMGWFERICHDAMRAIRESRWQE